ncbi:MAG: 3-isopropylmalate dehydrogenase [candidate division NC10 bacterium]|nr:3-isopropylmalate dehydrogenase [candidate division NC10 bacterium]
MPKIAVLPGDGIGPEVTQETVKVLKVAAERFALSLVFEEGLLGGSAIDATGSPLPKETVRLCKESDAILFGAVGGPKWDALSTPIRPERGLLNLRRELSLYANLRPAKVFAALIDASPLKRAVVEGADILVVRELIGGIYYGDPKGIEKTPEGERAVDTCIYTTHEVKRIAEVAFQAALKRRRKVTSVDKANVMATSELWRGVVREVAEAYPEVTLEHMYSDNCAMQLVRDPKQFDVIVADNLFGDLLSDEAAMIVGSIGLLPSASLGTGTGLYEPVHGSAPDIAGKDLANPLAAILSAAMLLRYSLDHDEAARAVERAVEEVLHQGYRTIDIAQTGTKQISTKRMGDLVAEALAKG